jgi:squalene-hopene/tetraprenyl-beta-curcumene cyclase
VATNLSTTVTTLAMNQFVPAAGQATLKRSLETHGPNEHALWPDTATVGDTVTDDAAHNASSLHHHELLPANEEVFSTPTIDWLLDSQQRVHDALTGKPGGGWAANESPGALPNACDTGRALLALAKALEHRDSHRRDEITRAAKLGLDWLLRLQNDDGGWATFAHELLSNEFAPSSVDATVAALRAIHAWRRLGHFNQSKLQFSRAVELGWRYLTTQQRADGSFVPLWFGNELQPDDENPVLGAADVLVLCSELNQLESETATTAIQWLVSAQHSTGGWGPPRTPIHYSNAEGDGFNARRTNEVMAKFCTVEETAAAVAALLPVADTSSAVSKAVSLGLTWLINAVERDAHRRPAVLGFYPSKIWYHERLYPLVFAAGALSLAASRLAAERPTATTAG